MVICNMVATRSWFRARVRRPGRAFAAGVACVAIIGLAACTPDGAETMDTPADADSVAVPDTTASNDTAGPAGARNGADGPAQGSMEVRVWFARGEEVVPATRWVPASADTLSASLRALLAGPTTIEREQGLTSWFSPETANALLSAQLQDRVAIVDLRDLRAVIPNASSSLGSTLLLDALNGTVFDASAADSVEYRFDGSCEAFGEFVQRGCIRYGRNR